MCFRARKCAVGSVLANVYKLVGVYIIWWNCLQQFCELISAHAKHCNVAMLSHFNYQISLSLKYEILTDATTFFMILSFSYTDNFSVSLLRRMTKCGFNVQNEFQLIFVVIQNCINFSYTCSAFVEVLKIISI